MVGTSVPDVLAHRMVVRSTSLHSWDRKVGERDLSQPRTNQLSILSSDLRAAAFLCASVLSKAGYSGPRPGT